MFSIMHFSFCTSGFPNRGLNCCLQRPGPGILGDVKYKLLHTVVVHFMCHGATGHPESWSDILGVSVRVFLDEFNIYIDKSDGSP